MRETAEMAAASKSKATNVELKTRPTGAAVGEFIDTVDDPTRREDTRTACRMMAEITGQPPEMWGPAIIGFGSYRYTYDSGRSGEWMRIGLSPRKQNLTLYIVDGFDAYESIRSRLGKHSVGKSCLYVKRLADIDMDALRELVAASWSHVGSMHPD